MTYATISHFDDMVDLRNQYCQRETEAQHPQSPGIVGDDEEVALILFDPDQWNNGDFSSAAFSKTRLARGELSVCRADYTTLTDVYSHVVEPQRRRNPSRVLAGAATAICATIRSIRSSNAPSRQIFCVLDAPIIGGTSGNYLGHAHIGFSDVTRADGFWSQNSRAAAIANLSLAFRERRSPPISLNDIFND